MATLKVEAHCLLCKEETNKFTCRGCSKYFGSEHLTEHRQSMNNQLQHVQNDYDQFRTTLDVLEQDPEKHPLIKQIDQWRKDAIEQIEETAKKCREKLIKYLNPIINETKIIFDDLKEQPKSLQETNEFNEIDLNELNQKLQQLKNELDQPSTISVERQSTPFISRINVRSTQQLIHNINPDQEWKQYGTNRAGGYGRGNRVDQLCYPCGMFIDDDQTIYIADTSNNRIVAWKKDAMSGQTVAGGNQEGARDDQLSRPMDVLVDRETDCLIISDRKNRRVVKWPRQNGRSGETIISDVDCSSLVKDNDGSLYVCDFEKHEVRRWKVGETNGTIVAGGNGRGSRLDQLDHPYWIFVDEEHSVYVSDWNNHRVMKWVKGAEQGIVVAGGEGPGNGLRQLSFPEGIIVDRLGNVYIADRHNHRVMRWVEGAQEGTIILGRNGHGTQPNQFDGPVYLLFDRQKNFYVTDWGNHRIMKFSVNSTSS